MIKDFISDITKYLPSVIIPAIVSFISIPIITRFFLPAIYGDYVLVLTTITLLSSICGWLNVSIIRFYPVYDRDSKLNEFYTTVILSALISIGIISLIFSGFLFLVGTRTLRDLYYLMQLGLLVFILTSFFSVLLHFLRIKRQVKWYSSFSVWESLAAFGLGMALIIIFHYGIEGLLWGSVLSVGLALPLLWKITIQKSLLKFKTKDFFLPLTSQMAKYGFPITAGEFAAWLLGVYSGNYILKFFWTSREVGIYSASYGISGRIILLLISLFLLAGRPIAINIWEREGKEKSQDFVSKLARYYLIILLPAVVGLIALARPLFKVLVAPEYYEGWKISPLFALGIFFLGLGHRFQIGTLFYKKTPLIMLCTILSALLSLAFSFLLVPQYGYLGAGLGLVIGYSFYLISNIIVSRRFFVWLFPFKSLIKILGASAIMGIIVYYLGNNLTTSALLNLILSIVIGGTVYFTILFFLGEPQKKELQELVLIRRKIIRR